MSTSHSFYSYYIRYLSVSKFSCIALNKHIPKIQMVTFESNFEKDTYDSLFWNCVILTGLVPGTTIQYKQSGILKVSSVNKEIYSLLDVCKHLFLPSSADLIETAVKYRNLQHSITIKLPYSNIYVAATSVTGHLLEPFKARLHFLFSGNSTQLANAFVLCALQYPAEIAFTKRLFKERRKQW